MAVPMGVVISLHGGVDFVDIEHKSVLYKKYYIAQKNKFHRGLLAQDLESMCLCSPLFEVHIHTSYLSFFLHRQNFWRIKFPQKFTQ